MQKYIKMYYKSKQNSLIKNITIEKKTKHKLKVIKKKSIQKLIQKIKID